MPKRKLFLLIYGTHWAFSLGISTIQLLRYRLSREQHVFSAVFYLKPIDATFGEIHVLYPVPPKYLVNFKPEEHEKLYSLGFDYQKFQIVGRNFPDQGPLSAEKNLPPVRQGVSEEKMQSEVGPYLSIAVICERVLQEKDGVNTLVRIFDQWNVHSPFPGPTTIPLSIVVSLIAGRFIGQLNVVLRGKSPSGKILQLFEHPPMELKGKAEGERADIIFNVHFTAQEQGTYWFEVLFNGEVKTKIPLLVTHTQLPSAGQSLSFQPTPTQQSESSV